MRGREVDGPNGGTEDGAMATESSEKPLWTGRPSQMTAFGFYFVTVVIAALFLVASFYAYSADMASFAQYPLYAFLVTLLVALGKYIVVRSTTYTLSSERLQIETGLLSRSSEEIELYRVRDWAIVQPFLLRLVGQGHVRVMSNDASAPDLFLEGVRRPNKLRDLLRTNVEEARERKRVRHLDVE